MSASGVSATSVYRRLPCDFQNDFAPITVIAQVPNVLVVNASTPAKSVAELVGLLQAKPGQCAYGCNGNGTAQPSAALPDVPTLEEAGLKGFDIGTWFGVLAPAGTPKEVVARLNAEMVRVIYSPEFRQRMAEIGAEPIGNPADEMARQVKEQTEKFARLVNDANVVIE